MLSACGILYNPDGPERAAWTANRAFIAMGCEDQVEPGLDAEGLEAEPQFSELVNR